MLQFCWQPSVLLLILFVTISTSNMDVKSRTMLGHDHICTTPIDCMIQHFISTNVEQPANWHVLKSVGFDAKEVVNTMDVDVNQSQLIRMLDTMPLAMYFRPKVEFYFNDQMTHPYVDGYFHIDLQSRTAVYERIGYVSLFPLSTNYLLVTCRIQVTISDMPSCAANHIAGYDHCSMGKQLNDTMSLLEPWMRSRAILSFFNTYSDKLEAIRLRIFSPVHNPHPGFTGNMPANDTVMDKVSRDVDNCWKNNDFFKSFKYMHVNLTKVKIDAAFATAAKFYANVLAEDSESDVMPSWKVKNIQQIFDVWVQNGQISTALHHHLVARINQHISYLQKQSYVHQNNEYSFTYVSLGFQPLSPRGKDSRGTLVYVMHTFDFRVPMQSKMLEKRDYSSNLDLLIGQTLTPEDKANLENYVAIKVARLHNQNIVPQIERLIVQNCG